MVRFEKILKLTEKLKRFKSTESGLLKVLMYVFISYRTIRSTALKSGKFSVSYYGTNSDRGPW